MVADIEELEIWTRPKLMFDDSMRRKSSHRKNVNRVPPDTEIHEQMTVTNGYGKVCTTTSTPSTTVRPLWTIT